LERRLEKQLTEREQARKFIERTIKEQRLNRQREELVLAEAEARLVKARLRSGRPDELLSSREAKTFALDLQYAELEVEYRKKRMSALLRSAEAQLAVLSTQERRADRRVHEIEVAIEEMVRTAPMPGTVIYVANWKEEKKKVGDSVWRGESVVELPDLSRMMGEGIVQETYAGRVKVGQPVTIRLDAHPELEFDGRVASIWKNVQDKSWLDRTKVVRLAVELGRTDSRRMRPGMRFRGRIELERAQQALLLPLQAVFIGPGGPLVYRRTPVGYETVPVDLGRRDEEWVEVLGGVDEGDSVALTDLRGIRAEDT
jgi:multidrug efflux pump subunit AcrA (membrane-fusion protein)